MQLKRFFLGCLLIAVAVILCAIFSQPEAQRAIISLLLVGAVPGTSYSITPTVALIISGILALTLVTILALSGVARWRRHVAARYAALPPRRRHTVPARRRFSHI